MIPYKVYESVIVRAERRNKLMSILLILMLLALIGTNAAWILM